MFDLELWLDVGMKPPKTRKSFFEITKFTSAVQRREFSSVGKAALLLPLYPISGGDQEQMETRKGEGKNKTKPKVMLSLFSFPSRYPPVF